MKKLQLLYNYLIYRFKSTNEHGVHSPFLFDLLLGTIYNKKAFYCYRPIEDLRKELMDSKKILHCVDLGAGSLLQNKTSKSISEIVKVAAKPEKYAQLLFRLVNHFQPATILELGTSLGISSAYMACANSRSAVITIEGCTEIAAVARQNFKKLELKNIEQLIGNFDERLPEVLKKIDQLDFAFFDGNHRKIPTINYFEQCLEKASERSVFIFDDIYWSDEMKQAWQEIKNNDRVTVTIDLFYFGIVFFRKEQVKEHFVIRY